MSTEWSLLQPWAAVIVPTLLHFLWQGALVALLGGVTLMACRRSSPATRYALSLGLFAVMGVAPLVTAVSLYSGVSLSLPVSSSAIEPTLSDGSHRQTEESAQEFAAWQPFVLLAWMTGVVVCSLRLTGGLIWYVWLTRRLQPIPQELTAVVRRLTQQLGLSARVRVMVSSAVREPLAMRIIQPLIVLPASWLLAAPPLVVEAVLAHELAHIRRHDLWVNLLQRIVEALLFFHPAVWWLSRQIRRERELCCDALAVAVTGRAVEYAQALEAVARYRLAWSSPAMAAGMGGDRMALLERVRRVLGLETAAETGWWPVGLAGLLLAAACSTGVMLSSGMVHGDDEKPAAPSAEKEKVKEQEKADAPRREGDAPRGPRESERRDVPRGEGDRRPEEGRREEGRPRDGERPPGPPREGDRRPEERPRDGERGPQPPRGPRGPQPEGDVMHELLMTIRELRQEVQMLREEMRSMRRPGPIDGPRGGDDAFRPRGDFVPRGPDGRGPQPPREGDGRPREGRPNPEGRDPGSSPRGEPREGAAPGRREGRDPTARPDAAPRGERRDEALGRPASEEKPAAPRSE